MNKIASTIAKTQQTTTTVTTEATIAVVFDPAPVLESCSDCEAGVGAGGGGVGSCQIIGEVNVTPRMA
jgi:hypothetical protein